MASPVEPLHRSRTLAPAELVWLLALTAKADERAFERLYRATRSKLYGAAVRLMPRANIADDVVREAYVKVWRQARGYNPHLIDPMTWMSAILREDALDRLREHAEPIGAGTPKPIETSADIHDDGPAQEQANDDLQRLLDRLGMLDEDHRELVLSAYYSGWTRAQLAQNFDKPVEAVTAALRLGLSKIRDGEAPTRNDDDRDLLAAEYVLGPLDAIDRTNARMLMAIDPEFAVRVRLWERRLAALDALIVPVEPPPEIWIAIKAQIGKQHPGGPLWLPDETAALPLEPVPPVIAFAPEPEIRAPPPAAAKEATPEPADAGAPATLPDAGDRSDLSDRLRAWRQFAITATVAAALLAAFVAVREIRPGLLPAALRPQPVEIVRTIELPSPKMAEFVAVFQEAGSPPAFLLTVDAEHGTFSVRRVGATSPSGKSYELWITPAGANAPRSLGVVGVQEFTIGHGLNGDSPALSRAAFTISLEPAGGSRTGKPTGPAMHGRLIETTPPAFPAATP
jgi:RNA polymerase sigma factor (sigma-70 family)